MNPREDQYRLDKGSVIEKGTIVIGEIKAYKDILYIPYCTDKRSFAVYNVKTGGLLFTISGKLALANNVGNIINYSDKAVVSDLDNFLKEFNLALFLKLRTYSVFNNHLYFLVDAYKFFEDGSKPPFTSLTEDSNPVVVKIKLKWKSVLSANCNSVLLLKNNTVYS